MSLINFVNYLTILAITLNLSFKKSTGDIKDKIYLFLFSFIIMSMVKYYTDVYYGRTSGKVNKLESRKKMI